MPINMPWDAQRVARTLLILAVVGAAIWMLWRFLPALAWAGVLAIATWPLRRALAERGVGKTGIAALLTLLLALVLVLPLIAIGIQAAREGHTLLEWARGMQQNGGLATPDWVAHLPYVGDSLAAWWSANLGQSDAARALIGRVDTGGIFSFTRTLGLELASRVTILVFTVLTLFFLYRDGPGVITEARAIADRLFGPPGQVLGRDFVAAIRGTINGLVLVGLVEGVLLGVAYVVAGLPHAALLGLATGVLGTIPFGAPLVFVLCGLVLLGQSHTTAAIALVVFGTVVVFIADHFVRPLLIGSSTRLPFLWVLLGIFAGLESFGLIGLFLGPAIMSALIAIWREAAE